MNNTVSGLFSSYSNAQWAFEVLGIYGVDNSQISVVARGSKTTWPAGTAITKFIEMGFTQEEADFYAEGVKRGDFLISVALDEEDEHLIRGILHGAGGVDMNSSREVWHYGNAHVLNPNVYA